MVSPSEIPPFSSPRPPGVSADLVSWWRSEDEVPSWLLTVAPGRFPAADPLLTHMILPMSTSGELARGGGMLWGQLEPCAGLR